MPLQRLVCFAFATLALLASTSANAADWPQFLGPNRNGQSPETGLLKNWPSNGPPLKWKITNLGTADAFSAPSIANGRVFLLTVAGNEEFVTALDAMDGGKIWSKKIGKVGPNTASPDYSGPRSTPTVDGDVLYALGSAGDLVCLNVADGAKRWSKSLSGDFNGKPADWAYSESPLIDGDFLIVTPGGNTATVISLRKQDGSVNWKCPIVGKGKNGKGPTTPSYGSPIRIEVGGIKQYVCVLNSGIVGVSAGDGKFQWRYDKPSNKQAINIATPVFHDGMVFNNSGYNSGGGAVKLTVEQGKVKATELWFEKDLTSAQAIGGFIRVGDHLYGTAAAGKGGKGGGIQLVCVEMKTGKIVWKNTCVGSQGALCVADGMLYVRGENAKLALVEATPAGYKEHGRLNLTKAGKRPAWPYPVVADGCLYLRDMGTLSCYNVRDPKK